METPKGPVKIGMENWVDFVRQHKMWFVENTDRGDIQPTVIVERDGEVLAIAMADEVDKYKGLQAAQILHAGFDPDALIVFFDAHVAKAKPGETEEEFKKRIPPGTMQKMCDEEGACDLGLITDCLICHRIDRDLNLDFTILPYSYHGKGTTFQWKDDDFLLAAPPGETKQKGLIPEALLQIMQEPVLSSQEILRKSAAKMEFSEERQRYHTGRACLQYLGSLGFIIFDLLTARHPEWSKQGEEKDMAKSFTLQELLPEEGITALMAAMDANKQNIGKPEFHIALVEALQPYQEQLTAKEIDAEYLAYAIESRILSSVPQRQEPPFPNLGPNGDQSEYLGEGEYVGDVPVSFMAMPDGSIRSLANAEVKPEPQDIPPGAKLVSAGNNPKIVLDSGRTVCGCQVWWQPAEQSKHEHGPDCGCGHDH